MEPRADDAVELAQALDDDGVLLLDHKEDVAGERCDHKQDEDEAYKAAKEVEDCVEHRCSFERVLGSRTVPRAGYGASRAPLGFRTVYVRQQDTHLHR